MFINKTNLALLLNQVATHYKEAVLANEVAIRLLEQVDFLEINPKLILNLGCRTGFTTNLLKEKFPSAIIVSLDIAEKMLYFPRDSEFLLSPVCADPESLPFFSDSFDLVYSNLTLQWFDFLKVFREVHRLLIPQGLFLFSTLGVDTLREARECLDEIKYAKTKFDFIDMHHLGDALLQNAFLNPVVSMEHLTLTFTDVPTFLKKIESMAYQSFLPNLWQEGVQREAFTLCYEKLRENNLLPATFEIIYGFGSKRVREEETKEVVVPFSAIKKH